MPSLPHYLKHPNSPTPTLTISQAHTLSFNIQHSTFRFLLSTFNLQHSTFIIQLAAFTFRLQHSSSLFKDIHVCVSCIQRIWYCVQRERSHREIIKAEPHVAMLGVCYVMPCADGRAMVAHHCFDQVWNNKQAAFTFSWQFQQLGGNIRDSLILPVWSIFKATI